MSGAINYDLVDDVHRVIDADVQKEIVDFDHVNEVDITKIYTQVLAMEKDQAMACVAAAVQKYPFETYRILALYAERGKK